MRFARVQPMDVSPYSSLHFLTMLTVPWEPMYVHLLRSYKLSTTGSPKAGLPHWYNELQWWYDDDMTPLLHHLFVLFLMHCVARPLPFDMPRICFSSAVHPTWSRRIKHIHFRLPILVLLWVTHLHHVRWHVNGDLWRPTTANNRDTQGYEQQKKLNA